MVSFTLAGSRIYYFDCKGVLNHGLCIPLQISRSMILLTLAHPCTGGTFSFTTKTLYKRNGGGVPPHVVGAVAPCCMGRGVFPSGSTAALSAGGGTPPQHQLRNCSRKYHQHHTTYFHAGDPGYHHLVILAHRLVTNQARLNLP